MRRYFRTASGTKMSSNRARSSAGYRARRAPMTNRYVRPSRALSDFEQLTTRQGECRQWVPRCHRLQPGGHSRERHKRVRDERQQEQPDKSGCIRGLGIRHVETNPRSDPRDDIGEEQEQRVGEDRWATPLSMRQPTTSPVIVSTVNTRTMRAASAKRSPKQHR